MYNHKVKEVLIFKLISFKFKLIFFLFTFALYKNLIIFILYMISLVISVFHGVLEYVWFDLIPVSECSPLKPKIFHSCFQENLYVISKMMPFDTHRNEVMHRLSLIIEYQDCPGILVESVKSPELYSPNVQSKQAYADIVKCQISGSTETGFLLQGKDSYECKSSYFNRNEIHSSNYLSDLMLRYNKSESIWFDYPTQDQQRRAEERIFHTKVEFEKLPIIEENLIFESSRSFRLGPPPKILISSINEEFKWDLNKIRLMDNSSSYNEISQIIKTYASKREPFSEFIQDHLRGEVSPNISEYQISNYTRKILDSLITKTKRYD